MHQHRQSLLPLVALVTLLAACTNGGHAPTPTASAPAAIITPASPTQSSPPGAAASPHPEPWRIVGFSFVSPTEGWLVRLKGFNAGPMQVLHTINAGDTWSIQYDAIDPIPVAVQFIDAQHGWIVGTTGYAPFGGDAVCHQDIHKTCQGAVLSTSDGGATWRMTSPTLLWPTQVQFTDREHGWMLAPATCHGAGCIHQDVTVFHTNDGGSTWTTSVVEHVEAPASSVYSSPDATLSVVDARTALVASPDAIFATTDAGATWQVRGRAPCRRPGPGGGLPSQFSTLNASTAWALCDEGGAAAGFVGGELYRTTDAARSWAVVAQAPLGFPTPAPGAGTLPSAGGMFQFLTATDGWDTPADHASYVYKTSDGGYTWAGHQTPLPAIIDRLQFVDEQHGWVANGSQLARTTDGGAHWAELNLPD